MLPGKHSNFVSDYHSDCEQMLTKKYAIMEEDQTFHPYQFKAATKTTNGINGKLPSNGITHAIEGEKIKRLNSLMLRLQEMERLNASLKKLLDQQTKELAEAVAVNAKSISIIAHDLRSPICTVLTAMEFIKDSLVHQNTDEIEHCIKIATGSAHIAIDLLDNLAEWAILQKKGQKFNPVKINLKQFIRREIEDLSNYANQKKISLNFFISPDLDVCIDLQMARTIIRNLINNAIKFTDTGGEITVSARERHPYIEIAVTDNGMGISSEDQKHIFKNEKIFSGPPARNGRSSGLGLNLCREFAEMHGGHISLESKPGKGSKFKFSLPV